MKTVVSEFLIKTEKENTQLTPAPLLKDLRDRSSHRLMIFILLVFEILKNHEETYLPL